MIRHQFHLTLTQALLESLELRRILYVLLSGVTAGDGLNFNRAFLLLVEEGSRVLQGEFAIGPIDGMDAHRIWQEMAVQEFTLPRVMAQLDTWERDTRAASISREFQRVTIPLPLPAQTIMDHSFLHYVAGALAGHPAAAVNDRTLAIPGTALTLQQFAVVPLRIQDRAIGVLLVDNPYNGRTIEQQELDDLTTLANLAAIAVERARLYERVRRLAEQDGLTGLLNRRRFDELLSERFQESRIRKSHLSLLLLDVDRFKRINDRDGHMAGDDVLRRVAAAIQHRLRVTDAACRYGGDEFALLIPRSSGPEALAVADHLRAVIAESSQDHPMNRRITVSIGVAAVRDDHSCADALLIDADAALYTAKREGRDRAVLYEPAMPDSGVGLHDSRQAMAAVGVDGPDECSAGLERGAQMGADRLTSAHRDNAAMHSLKTGPFS